jgi:hypothetical protein
MKVSLIFILLLAVSLSGCKTISNNFEFNENQSKIDINSKRYPITIFEGNVMELYSNEAIPLAKVTLRGEDGINRGALTDSTGFFLIKDIPLGECSMDISSNGYQEIMFDFNIKEHAYYKCEIKLKQFEIEKPVIYLYPTQKQTIEVRLNYNGALTHTYPKYPTDGWQVIAEPNGTLWDEKGLEYYALFWEGKPHKQIIPKDGFVVPGKETAAFLEEKLAYLGLNRKEANEFIMYWLPRMEENNFNFIHFSGKQYEEQAALIINPKPETIIRVMMLTQALESKINIPLQDLTTLKNKRKGYTVVEWGGSLINTIVEKI